MPINRQEMQQSVDNGNLLVDPELADYQVKIPKPAETFACLFEFYMVGSGSYNYII